MSSKAEAGGPMPFPTTVVGGVELSRMLCGTNTFFGYSHFSQARSTWLRRYFTEDRIVEVLRRAAELGITGVVAPPEPRMPRLLGRLREETGLSMHYIATPGRPTAAETLPDIDWCAEAGATICMLHPTFTDRHLHGGTGKITDVEALLARIRSLGMVPGLCTHRPETLPAVTEAGYDVEVFILPLNVAGFLMPLETDWQGRIIRETPKPVICIKPLAAGRVMPPSGIPFVYQYAKPTDMMCIGMLSPEEVEEDVAIALAALRGQAVELELSVTRSKEIYLRRQKK